MRFEAPTIAEFGREAGFVGAELHTATAIAVAGSGGHDDYHVRAGAPGCGRWVGLWAIDVDEWPEYSPEALMDPRGAATAAHELTRRCDGFGWSAVWRAGHDLRYLDHAATCSTIPPFLEREHSPVSGHHHRDFLPNMRQRLGARNG